MKNLTLLLIIFGSLFLSQTKVNAQILGFTNRGFIGMPDTVHQKDSVNFSLYILNKSAIPFSGTVNVKLSVNHDTILSLGSKSVNLNEGDSALFNSYLKINGVAFKSKDVNIVVVWPEAPGAKSDSIKKMIWVSLPLGMNDIGKKDKQLLCYPNPVINDLYLKYAPRILGIRKIIIYNMEGKKMLQCRSLPVPMSNLPDGLYVVEFLENNGDYYIRKVEKSEY